jgi:hypothetical protein
MTEVWRGPTNPVVRRWLRRWRQRLGDDPVWLPLVLRATPIGTARRLTDATQLVIEGFPRSGNTYAVEAIRHAERTAGREIDISSHVHTPSAVKAAVRGRYPTLVVVRPPADTIVSLLIAAPHVRPVDALDEWIHHHRELWPYRDRFVVATFAEITERTPAAVERVNAAFGTTFATEPVTEPTRRAIFAAIDANHQERYGDQEHLLPRPSPARERQAEALRRELDQPSLHERLAAAESVFSWYAGER